MSLSEFFIQQLVFLLKFFDQTHLRVLIFYGFIRDIARFTCILQCIDVFVNVHVARIQTSNHQAVGVAAQTVP